LYSTPNVIQVIKSKRVRWEGHVACMGKRRCAYRVLMRNPEARRKLGRARHRWDNTRKFSD
jgi:hypothetical protein